MTGMDTKNELTVAAQNKPGLIETFALAYNVEPKRVLPVLQKTIMPGNKEASQEEVMAFLVVANQYKLNPFTKEIYAFPAKGGGITPVIGVDGWVNMIHREAQLDGIEFEYNRAPDGSIESITAIIYRKDMDRPIRATEFLSECRRNSDPWKNMPMRMLRHRALIQCGRIAFGICGIMDDDEAEQMIEREARVVEDDHMERAQRLLEAGRNGIEEDFKDVDEQKAEEPAPTKDPEPTEEEDRTNYRELCKLYDEHSGLIDRQLKARELPMLMDMAQDGARFEPQLGEVLVKVGQIITAREGS
jgi:phage recombination protein Bet